MLVYATDKWNRDIVIPKLGIVRRPYPRNRKTPNVVSSAIGKWLVDRGYATYEPPEESVPSQPAASPSPSPPPQEPAQQQKQEEASSPVEPTKAESQTTEEALAPSADVEAAKERAIAFLREASAEQIAETKSIGKNTAYALLERRAHAQGDISWEDVEQSLSDRQQQALQERFATTQQEK